MSLKGPKIIERSLKDQEMYGNGKETWVESQCQEVEECLRKENNMEAYQLVKYLTTEKLGKSTRITIQARKYFNEEILNRWTDGCSDLNKHVADGDLIVLDCPQLVGVLFIKVSTGMCGHYRYTFQLCHYMIRCVFQYQII